MWVSDSFLPDMEYIRGSDWGGGVGGILYTARAGVVSWAHYNGRGDVVTRTSGTGSLTYAASYEAFGTRTQEAGTNPDRQRANTKEEDPTGLLNEGHRYRDLELGMFISRDPAGFVDGPNVYTYVVQNPWSSFDPEGLHVWVEKSNPNEPAGHISFSVGDPVSGKYKSYSFGVITDARPLSVENGLQGTIYIDDQHGGDIDPDRFYYTAPETDEYIIEKMDKLEADNRDKRSPYRLGNGSCRDWTFEQFQAAADALEKNKLGVKDEPPVKTAKAIVEENGEETGRGVTSGSTSRPTTEKVQPTTANNPKLVSSSGSSTTVTRGGIATTKAATPSGRIGATATATSSTTGQTGTSTDPTAKNEREEKKDESGEARK